MLNVESRVKCNCLAEGMNIVIFGISENSYFVSQSRKGNVCEETVSRILCNIPILLSCVYNF